MPKPHHKKHAHARRSKPGTLRRQPRVTGGRYRIGGGLTDRIEAAVENEQGEYGVTRPMIVTVALALMFGIDLDEEEKY